MVQTLKVRTKKIFHEYWKVSVFIWVVALSAGAANAQTTTDPKKVADEKRAQKMSQRLAPQKTELKTFSLVEFRQRNAAAKDQQNNVQQAPASGTAPVKVDTKTDPNYQSRSASGYSKKGTTKATAASSNSTSNSKAPIQ